MEQFAGIVGVCGLGALICWVITEVRIFRDNVVLGVVGFVCPPFALIYGWIKAGEHNSWKVMVTWSVLLLVIVVLQFLLVFASVQ